MVRLVEGISSGEVEEEAKNKAKSLFLDVSIPRPESINLVHCLLQNLTITLYLGPHLLYSPIP